MANRTSELPYLPKTRTEAFSDGVIAIIVTVLVLEIHVPTLSGRDLDAQLLSALWHAVPLVGAYAVSFLVLLVFWVAHHHLLHSLQRVDRNFLWLNGLFLMILAFVPAPTALIGSYPGTVVGSVLYGVVLALAGLCFLAMRAYATVHGQLLHHELPARAARRAIRKGLLSPALYGAGAALAFADTRLAWAMFGIVPLIFILPGAYERAAHQLED
jgi:uncharacterized membrane protein